MDTFLLLILRNPHGTTLSTDSWLPSNIIMQLSATLTRPVVPSRSAVAARQPGRCWGPALISVLLDTPFQVECRICCVQCRADHPCCSTISRCGWELCCLPTALLLLLGVSAFGWLPDHELQQAADCAGQMPHSFSSSAHAQGCSCNPRIDLMPCDSTGLPC